MRINLEDIPKYTAYVVAASSLLRVGLHWLRGLLELWLSPKSALWGFYDRLELTFSYISISLAAYGKKVPSSTLEAPVTKAASEAEGRIVK